MELKLKYQLAVLFALLLVLAIVSVCFFPGSADYVTELAKAFLAVFTGAASALVRA